MNTSILCTLLAQRINPEYFQLWGLDAHWMDDAYDTPANRAIVADVVANYDTLKVAVIKADKLAEIRADAKAVIEAKYPVWYQANVANGIYSTVIGDTMKAGITSVITESNRCEDLVDAATTEAEINAVTPVWPVL